MILTDRLRKLASDRDISQSELARRLNLRQSTINGIFTGRQSGSTHLHRIARELRTTPAYLSGETDDSSVEIPTHYLSIEEEEWIDCLRSLDDELRHSFLVLLKRMAINNHAGAQSQTLHSPTTGFRHQK